MSNKQRWVSELEALCNTLAKRNKGVNRDSMEDRDRLIRFANRLADRQLVSRPQVISLIDKVDQQIFGTG